MRTSGEVVRLAIDSGHYDFGSFQVKKSYMCYAINAMLGEHIITRWEAEITRLHISEKITPDAFLSHYFLRKLGREPTAEDVAEFWEEFIDAHS